MGYESIAHEAEVTAKIEMLTINNIIGNRTLCHPIWSVIILVIKQIRLPLHSRPILLISHMITDRVG